MVDALGPKIPARLPLVDVARSAAKSEDAGAAALEAAAAKGELGGVALSDAQKQALQSYAASARGGPPPAPEAQKAVAELFVGTPALRAQLGDAELRMFAGALSRRDLDRLLGSEAGQAMAAFVTQRRTDPAPKSLLVSQLAALRSGKAPIVDVARSPAKQPGLVQDGFPVNFDGTPGDSHVQMTRALLLAAATQAAGLRELPADAQAAIDRALGPDKGR